MIYNGVEYPDTGPVKGHGPHIEMYSGKPFYVLRPRVEDVSLRDICHNLGNINRYNGATRQPYSVAQHSILVADLLERKFETPHLFLDGLVHDFAEAYLGDMIRPVKHLLPNFQAIEAEVMSTIFRALEIGPPDKADRKLVKLADNWALMMEVRKLRTKNTTWGPELDAIYEETANYPQGIYTFRPAKNQNYGDTLYNLTRECLAGDPTQQRQFNFATYGGEI